ncbi:MAG TPA: type II secretion system F family protein [Candidatus Sulfotelmatobacter sp.]|jgi:Flp pilus assembly protein TadB|nr:type II secretion system F family protein [Candidatus Sulfotelmatobacter sp.]
MSVAILGPEDIVSIAGFVGVVLAALGYDAVRHAAENSPQARARRRAIGMTEANRPVAQVASEVQSHAPRRSNPLVLQMRDLLRFVQDKGGSAGPALLGMAAFCGAAAAALAVMGLKLPLVLALPAALLGGFLGGWLALSLMKRRFRERFLHFFPEALDMIIRAVRAGVPVVQAIQTAGQELPHPVGMEFQRMGDALRIGLEPQKVMSTAADRIGIPDFRFFVVCLELQRETGGPLAETLENLSGIIRSRRDTRLKTRALTAQGRAASKVISLVPVLVMAGLESTDSDYLSVLFETPAGQHLLWLAGGLVVVGLVVINTMMRLED